MSHSLSPATQVAPAFPHFLCLGLDSKAISHLPSHPASVQILSYSQAEEYEVPLGKVGR